MTGQHAGLARAIATVGGLGERLPAPGTTAGSLPAAVLWWLACLAAPAPATRIALTAIGLLAAAAAGVWAAEVEVERRGARDPGPIVIDEVAGQWLTYLVALPFVPLTGAGPLALFAAAGFVLFRVFDVLKPWPIRSCEGFPGGVGVIADDLAAGWAAAVVLVIGWKILA
jgi:phosphatidylglycerophosphatase A